MITSLRVDRLKSALESQGLTQSELVKKSGVSRAQVSRLLASREARVREGTLKRLADALGVTAAELSGCGRLAQYRLWLAEETGTIDFRGIGMPSAQRQPIQEVFVDVDLLDRDVESPEGACLGGESSCRSTPRLPVQPIPATECIRTHDRVVVLGHPGSGKTTVLRFLAHCCAAGREGGGETPIYVRLPELCRAQEIDEDVDPVSFIAARAGDGGCGHVEQPLREALEDEKRRCLVLLDGLDEVGDGKQKERLVECLEGFIASYPRNRFAITSRIIGFESTRWRRLGFTVFRISGYSPAQLRTFAEKWSKVHSRSEREPFEEVLDGLQTAIFSNPRVLALASNPLTLTILVLLNWARGGALPRRRVDLYEKVVDVFLETWETNKRANGPFDDTANIDMDAREFGWLLSDLSLAMQKAGRTLAPRWWIAERMEEYLQQNLGFAPDEAKDACDRIIRYLVERTGLIEERGPDWFAFSHRTLQEYFASLGVVDEAETSRQRDVTQCLRGYYFNPQWSEVVRLVAAQLRPPSAESLLSTIFDDPDPVGRFLHRGQLLALWCLSDGTTVANRRMITGLFDSLKELGKSRWLGITLEVLTVLESLKGTRLESIAKESTSAILQAAKCSLDRSEYECLEEWVYMPGALECVEAEMLSEFESEAAREITVTLGERSVPVGCLNAKLLHENPDGWYSSACSILEDPRQSTELKETLVREFGRRAETDVRAHVPLRKLLRSSSRQAPSVRAACAKALGGMTMRNRGATTLLLRVLDSDSSEEVRRACAIALREEATLNSSVADRLKEILEADGSPKVRAGAAHGLSQLATTDAKVANALRQRLSLDDEDEKVKVACLWALERQVGGDPHITELFRELLGAAIPRVQRVAAQSLATAMAEERLDWDRRVVERVEHILMRLEDPCPDALWCLEAIAAARESRQGLRLERVLQDAMKPVGDRIELAFVFGSTARNRQEEQSDVDLLVIGDVSLKALSGPLREAEKTLGRRIEPVIYTATSFQQKHHAGDPFVLDVYRREKIPLITQGNAPSSRGLEDELRGLVAERLASTK